MRSESSGSACFGAGWRGLGFRQSRNVGLPCRVLPESARLAVRSTTFGAFHFVVELYIEESPASVQRVLLAVHVFFSGFILI